MLVVAAKSPLVPLRRGVALLRPAHMLGMRQPFAWPARLSLWNFLPRSAELAPKAVRCTPRVGRRMLGGKQLWLSAVTIAVAFTALAVPRVSAQGLQNVLRARARVFPAVGPGVAAVKRDSSGRYFILAEPASTISIFDGTGKRIDQFPNANSHGATIRYAVAIDLDSRGRLFVADRGDNSIKIFAPDGSLVAAIHVTAPTSVVALSDGQFAATTLQSKRLVQIMDEKGNTVRTFGDPSDQSQGEASAQPVMDRGRITGDSSGNIYFAFTSLPDPTVQRFDRFGYSAYGAVMSADQFGPSAGHTGHEVDLGYTMSGLYGPTSVGAWTDLHSLTSVSVGNRSRRGMGTAGTSSAAANSSSSSSSSSSSATGSTTVDGNVLAFNSDAVADPLDLSSPIFGGTGAPDFGLAYGQGMFMPGMFGMGFGEDSTTGAAAQTPALVAHTLTSAEAARAPQVRAATSPTTSRTAFMVARVLECTELLPQCASRSTIRPSAPPRNP